VDEVIDNIYWVILLLFWVVPRVLKWLAKRAANKQPQMKRAAPATSSQPNPQLAMEEVLEDIAAIDVDTAKMSAIDFAELVDDVRGVLARAEGIAHTIRGRGGPTIKLADAVSEGCIVPLQNLSEQLETRDAQNNRPDWDDGQRLRAYLDRLERLTEALELMVARRVHPETADLLETLDTAAQECLVPYLSHASRMNLDYPSRLAAVVFGTPGEDLAQLLDGTSLAPVVIEEGAGLEPRSWVGIASDVALDVFHSTRGLAGAITTSLHVLPPPMSIGHYSDAGSFIAGLKGGWLPRLFADSCGALMLGPAFAAGLAYEQERGEATVIRVGTGRDAALPPLHVRMFVACRALQHLGQEEEAVRRWTAWTTELGNPEVFSVQGGGGSEGSLSTQLVLTAVAEVVDHLMDEPLMPLGGFILPTIPSLACDTEILAAVERTAQSLVKGEAMDVSGRVIIAAAQLAVENSPALERRTATTAFQSLSGQGAPDARERVQRPGGGTLAAHLRSRELLARAIVTGAVLAPRSARLRGRPGPG